MKITTTQRGFKKLEFRDRYDEPCSLQESSLASESCIWLGAQKNRMHLTQEMVTNLLPYLEKFSKTGAL